MACNELAALRLGLMGLLGINDEAERQHELAELGDALKTAGPIAALSQASNLGDLKTYYETSVAELEGRVAKLPAGDAKEAYLRSLVILTKKVEMELESQYESLHRLYRHLDEIHDFVHEIYPA